LRRFLGPDATAARLERAAAQNHRAWWTASARADEHGEVHRSSGLTWIATPHEVTVAFPALPASSAGEALDLLVAEWRRRAPASVGCWSLTPTRPRDLGARLAARGFEWGWRPHWMALERDSLPADGLIPDGLTVSVDDDGDWGEMTDLPYYNVRDVAKLRNLARARPRRMWHVAGRLDGQIVGHALVYVTTGPLGVAGIYSVGVLPDQQNRGIGKAVSLAACRIGHDLGCHWAVLNSAADHLYERIGFRHVGWGQTWWMHGSVIAAAPPTQDQIAFAEAVGRGDAARLSALARQGGVPLGLDAPLHNGMTPMALAVSARQPAAADWLAVHGATLDVLHAWDLGWRDRVPALLAASPGLVDRRTGPLSLTPLHEAAARGDLDLTRALLAAGPDLTIRDAGFHATSLGWARHFRRDGIAALIEAAEAPDAGP
jgi:ribosomal protein S18 acetylase RimI-like enzyme